MSSLKDNLNFQAWCAEQRDFGVMFKMGRSVSKSTDPAKQVQVIPTLTHDPMALLLYGLLRDDLPAGRVVELIYETQYLLEQSRGAGIKLTNGWLARLAIEMATRLRAHQLDQGVA